MAAYRPLLDYWFGDFGADWPPAEQVKRWFSATRQDDAEMAQCFGALVEDALIGGLREWEAGAESRLALILLLDQLPRNIFRGTAQAFAGDARALALACDAAEKGMELSLPWAAQSFCYMPMMHAESLSSQQACVGYFEALKARVPVQLQATIASNLRFAREHLAIIERFGRFPHRNEVLGRDSSAEEVEFLQRASRYGQ